MGGGWLFDGVFGSCVFNRLAVSFWLSSISECFLFTRKAE